MSLQYKLFGGATAVAFEDAITAASFDGWALVGGPFFANGSYAQAMSRERKTAAAGPRKGPVPSVESIAALQLEVHGMEQARADEASKRGVSTAILDQSGYHPNALEIAVKTAVIEDNREWLREVEFEKAAEARKIAADAAAHPEKYPTTSERVAVASSSRDMTPEGRQKFSDEYEKQRAAGKDHATSLKAASDAMLKPGPTAAEIAATKAAADAKTARDAQAAAGR